MKVSAFDYDLPPHFIAQQPAEPRDHSRLLVLHRDSGAIEHRHFYDIGDYLRPGDLLVFNDSRVIPARLYGADARGGKVELLLLRRLGDGLWQALARPGKKALPGAVLSFGEGACRAEITARGENGLRMVHFDREDLLAGLGHAPLPPYIRHYHGDPARYQTVYARVNGSAAAPTAGLHFTPGLLGKLKDQGVRQTFVTLHIGLDTFQPVRVEEAEHHHIHTEWGEVGPETVAELNAARREARRIIPVGTTTVRLLEACAQASLTPSPSMGEGRDEGVAPLFKPLSSPISLFILPGYRFQLADALVTNFHLPKSTLLMLVSAYAGRERILETYEAAKREGYRFFSFGDAMLVL